MASIKVDPPRKLVEAVITRIANERGVCAKSVMQGSRYREHLDARIAAIREIWNAGKDRYSLTGMARAFGVNHATILYHVRPEFRARRKARNFAWRLANKSDHHHDHA